MPPSMIEEFAYALVGVYTTTPCYLSATMSCFLADVHRNVINLGSGALVCGTLGHIGDIVYGAMTEERSAFGLVVGAAIGAGFFVQHEFPARSEPGIEEYLRLLHQSKDDQKPPISD